MSEITKNASERKYQERFVEELEKYKWEALDELNGNKHKVTVDDLINYWRKELNRINADQLENIPLTDNEFNQVMAKVSKISNSYEAAKLLAIEGSVGKIDGIYRDDNPRLMRKQITLTIFKKAEVRGGDSSYRIAREVQTPNGNRFDIVLLINGLPLINIEQKRADKTLDEAFYQFRRYYHDGEYCNNFMAFSQMMVVNSEIETRYFATPKSYDDFNPSFEFHWSDKDNNVINHWQEVIKNFLMIPMAHQMVGDYLVIDEAREEENRRHMLMRPYQVYALQAIEGAAFGWDNDTKIPHGGFVWHTTGSGKTITSFKTALFLSTRAGFDKVIFLVDRRELDNRTSANFKAYAAYESVDVDDTRHTYELKKKLQENKNGIIVTTTFKLNSLVKELEEKGDNSLADKKVVFIIDEAHRTTMGQMMGVIKNYFKKNGLFYGFTGTPIFEENNVKGKINEKSELINTTEKLFGPLLHQYTIDEAIADKNVLGFHVDYINTGEFKSYDDLRDQLYEKIKQEKPEMSDIDIEHKIYTMSDATLERECLKADLFKYQDETHIPRVVERILNNWDNQSQNKEFNAILTVAYKNRVITTYKEFKKQLKEKNIKLNIAMTFSFGSENDPNPIDSKVAKEMFADYARFTGIEFVVGDRKHGEDAYFEDVVERATRGGSGRNSKNIDLVIVADQLLTGYDSKRLNTLYVDRSLELQGLIQAYSRTNRIFGTNKEFGTIINFQFPAITKETVDKALKLYGSGGSSSRVIVATYQTAVRNLSAVVPMLINTLPEPTEWKIIENNEEEKNAFIEAYKAVCGQLNTVQQYYEFIWDDDKFGITYDKWKRYEGAYKNLSKGKGSGSELELIIRPLPGRSKLVDVQEINASYIINLIGSKIKSTAGVFTIDSETLRIIHEQIQELSDLGDDEQAQLLKQFVDFELVPGHLKSTMSFDEAFEYWKSNRLKNAINAFAKEWGIDAEILDRSVTAFSYAQPETVPYVDEIIGSINYGIATNKTYSNVFEHNVKLIEKLPMWIAENKDKYS